MSELKASESNSDRKVGPSDKSKIEEPEVKANENPMFGDLNNDLEASCFNDKDYAYRA